jgi:AbrB family looped-hinge helix DNA binding protein
MGAQTKVSGKGQVVIPKDVRDRLHLAPGDRLDIVERPDGILLRKPAGGSGESFDAITARIRARVRHIGPAVPVEEMASAIAEMWAGGGPRWDA